MDGEVELMVLLMDRDKQWDDVYGVANVTVDYELLPEAADGTPTDDGSSTDTDGTATPEDDADEMTTDDESAADEDD